MCSDFVFGLERALNTRPSAGHIQTRYLRGFNSLVCNMGVDPRPILERHGIDPATFVDPDNQVNCMSAATMMEYCGSRLDDSMFGVRLAELQSPDVFGPVGVLARAAASFRQGLQCLADYLPVLHSPEGRVEILESRDTVEVRWVANGDLEAIQQPLLHGYMLMLKTLRMLGGAYFSPLYLRVGFEPGRRGAQALEKAAGCRIVRARVNAIVLTAEDLDRPMTSSNGLIYELLDGYFARVRQAAAPTLKERIEAYIGTALPSGNCSVSHCAARLGFSSRSLQKRLTQLGLSFSSVVEGQRAILAKHALRESAGSLDEIAMTLGYSDQTCFGRAFKRWTGLTPQAWRGSDCR
jgi:AraC-like DNA-binding protein